LLVVMGEVLGRIVIEQDSEPVLPVLWDVLRDGVFVIAVVLLGEAVHSRGVRTAEARERLLRAEAEREREAERRVTEERLRIARELHDVLAHTLAVMMVQTGLAVDLVDEQPAEAKTTLRTVRAAGREAMSELRATVNLLRSGDGGAASRAPMPGLNQVDALLEAATSAGLRVDLQQTGEHRPLPPAVDLTAYRIVQECLTNVVRHAHASSATIAVRYGLSDLVIEVTDNGHGGNGIATSGHGLTGMAERAAAVGGSLESGPGPAGGFRVRACLPAAHVPA
jgi:signal transduction histidine kinase